MEKLLTIFLLCFLGAALAGKRMIKSETVLSFKKCTGTIEESKDKLTGNLPLKREIVPEARKNNGIVVKKRMKSKNARKKAERKGNMANKEMKGRKATRRSNKRETGKGRKGRSKKEIKRENESNNVKTKNDKTNKRMKGKEQRRRKKKQAKKTVSGTKRRKCPENAERRKSENSKKVQPSLQNKLAETYTECEAQFLNYSNLNENKAKTIVRQVSRINKRSSALNKKQAKQGDFKKTYDILRIGLGGNESQLECNGEPVNATNRGTLLKY